MSKLPINTEFEGYEISDHYKAYKNYLYNEPISDTDICLRNDLKMLGSAITEAYSARKRDNQSEVSFEITNITEEDYNSRVRQTDYAFTTVEGRLKFGLYKSDVFPILRLPSVDRFGMIRYKKQLYSIIATSEPSKYVTYDGNGLLNLMLNAKNVKVEYQPSKFKITFGKNKINMSTMLYGVCYLHSLISAGAINYVAEDVNYIEDPYTMITPNATELLKKIVTPENINWLYRNEDKLSLFEVETDDASRWTQVLNYPTVILGMFGFANISKNGIDPDALNTVRDQLNDIVSIDRGIGKILSRDIISSTGDILAKKGDIVTRDLISTLNIECINEYYVSHMDVMNQGAKIACDIAIKSIPAGVLIPEEFRDDNKENLKDVPELTDKVYNFTVNEYPVVRQGTPLTAVVMQLIQMSEFTEYVQHRISPDESKLTKTIQDVVAKRYYTNTAIPVMKNEDVGEFKLNNVIYVTLEEEVMGNRHFKCGDNTYFVTEDGLKVPPAPHLTVYDIAALMSIMPRLNTDYIDRVSDKDIGLRKHICLIDEHLHKAMKDSCKDFSNVVYRTLKEVVEGKNTSIISDEKGKLESVMWALFNMIWRKLGGEGMTVVQIADTTNPAALASCIHRVNTITKTKHGVSDSMRFLAMGFYGRICPYETPASSKLGLTNTKACHATIENGELYTEYYRVVHVGGRHKVLTNKKYKMTVAEEENYIIADLMSLDLDEDMNILNSDDLVFARVPTVGDIEKMETQNVPVSAIEYVNCYPDQTLSPTATLIPFINSNDAVRVSYALNMARQSRPLIKREIPLILTKGFFDVIRATTVFQINAEDDGYIEDVVYNDRDAITQDTKVTVTVRYNHSVIYRHPNEKVYTNEENDKYMRYTFKLIEYSYKSVIERKVEVKPGDTVRKGDVIVSSNFSKDGIYAPGVNAFVGVIPVGYNYEDGVQISVRLSKMLTSYGHTDDTFTVRRTAYPKSTRGLGYIDSNATRIIKWEDGGRNQEEYATSDKLRGYIVNRKVVEKENRAQRQSKTKNYRVDTIYINPMSPGDKNCNRHGNKGVIPKIVNNSDMHYLLNGEHLDLCYNPAGFASRMNLGQIKELHGGLACRVLGIKVCVQSFNDVEWEEVVLLLSYAWDCANIGVDWANSQSMYNVYPPAMKAKVKNNERNIAHWKNTFTKDGCAIVINPKTGKPVRTPIVVGVNQVTKLIQEVDDKEHARGSMVSGGRYVSKYGRPTKGARHEGGQTIGEMEINGLMAYGLPNYIKELMHERGDNPYARQLMHLGLLGTDEVMRESDLVTLSEVSMRRSVEAFFNMFKALGVRLEIEEPEENILDVDDEKNEEKFLYMTGAVLGEVKPYVDRKVEKEDERYIDENVQAFDDMYEE